MKVLQESMKVIGKLFLKGLVAILPLAVTVYVLYWLGGSAESVMGVLLRGILPDDKYVPGMGMLFGFLLILLCGILLRAWIVRRIFGLMDRIMESVPLVKSLYGAVKDLMRFFDPSKEEEFDNVVMVSIPGTSLRLMGFVTRQDFAGLPAGIAKKDTVAVYLPMSYQLGGFTVMAPTAQVQPVDMSVEEAMRFCLTAGVSTGKPEPHVETEDAKS
jgi:uncharacterized membrane protein